jgi:hypothetical protein
MTLRPNQNLEEMLQAAVVVSWDDIVPTEKIATVHVQYRFAADHSLANLQIWVSEIRGHWLLVCEYSGVPSARKQIHLAFSNTYRSDLLAQLLQFVVEHQSAFARAPELNRDSLVQVQSPSEDEKARALKLVNEAQASNVLHDSVVFATAN